MIDREKVIEKHILQYLICHQEFEFNFKYAFNLNQKIGKGIENELGITILSSDELKKVLDDLVERNIIKLKIQEENKIAQKGTIKLSSISLTQKYIIDQGYVDDQFLFDYIDSKFFNTIDIELSQFHKIKELEDELARKNNILVSEIEEQNKKIKSFYNNIISIMAILIAAFAIIGFNIGGIKFIVSNVETVNSWNYAGSILLLNLSIITSLYVLFYLVNKISNSNRKESGKENKQNNIRIFSKVTVLILYIILIIFILVCFIMA